MSLWMVVSVSDSSCCKKCLSYVEIKPLLVQLVPIAPRLLHVAPCEARASVLFVATLYMLEYCDEVLSSLLFSRKKRLKSFSLSSQGRFSRPVIIRSDDQTLSLKSDTMSVEITVIGQFRLWVCPFESSRVPSKCPNAFIKVFSSVPLCYLCFICVSRVNLCWCVFEVFSDFFSRPS